MVKVDWEAAEELLVREALVSFPRLAADYPVEEFYGIFFDCDVVYTGVLGHMNTETMLRETAEECQAPGRDRAAPLYPGRTIEEVMEDLRWDGGGWKYHGLFDGPDFKEIASARHELLSTCGDPRAEQLLKEDFMTMACRAVVRLERSNVFDHFRRAPHFRLLCVYVQETVEEGNRRLQRVREAMQPS